MESNNREQAKWSSKSIGSKFQHNFFYFMIRMGGRRLAYFVLYFIVFYYIAFVPSVKKKTDPYLSRRFPMTSFPERFYNRFMMVLQLGKTLIDRAIVGIIGPESIHAAFADKDDVTKIKELDSGFILMMSHVGGWQVAMSALDLLDKPINLLMQLNEEDIDKHYYEHGEDTDSPFRIINPEGYLGGVIEMLNVLKKDEILCVMGDRVFAGPSSSVSVSFLNDMAEFPFSAYKIASLSGKPIVVLYSYKTGASSYRLKVADIIKVPAKLGKSKENYTPYVKQFVETLEAFTERYPYQFFNFYDKWDGLEEGNPAISAKLQENLSEK